MSYRKAYDRINLLPPVNRGNEFEKLFNKICEDAGILIFDRFRTSDTEQEIDGAVLIYSRVFLLEAKWEDEKTLAASKLYSFLGKINSKIDGTLGIFISHNELKENFINAFRNGIKQNCILIHGKSNIEDIIDEKVKIKDFLEYCFAMASTKHRIDINTSEYISLPDKSKFITDKTVIVQDNWKKIYEALMGNMSTVDFKANLETWYSKELDLSEKIINLNLYNTINLTFTIKDKLDALINKLIQKEKDSFIKEIVNKFKGNEWKNYAYENFCNELKSLKLNIKKEDRISIIKNVAEVLNTDWVLENKASWVIMIFYDLLSDEEKGLLAKEYLDIYCDTSREDRFPQKKFAAQIFKDILKEKKTYFEIIRSELLLNLKILKLTKFVYENDEYTADEIKKDVHRSFILKYKKVFEENKEDLRNFLEMEYDKL